MKRALRTSKKRAIWLGLRLTADAIMQQQDVVSSLYVEMSDGTPLADALSRMLDRMSAWERLKKGPARHA